MLGRGHCSWQGRCHRREQGRTSPPSALSDAPPRVDFVPCISPAVPFLSAPLCIHWDRSLPFPDSFAPVHSCCNRGC